MQTPRSNTAVLGQRIRIAREAKKLTQEELANAMGIPSMQSISELELGNRQLQAGELAKLVRALGRGLEYFTDPFLIEGEAKYSWRKAAGAAVPAPLQERIDKTVGLYRWMRRQDDSESPVMAPVLRLPAHASLEDAERSGERLAIELNLGEVPSRALLERMEHNLDVPVLFVDMDTEASAGFTSGVTVHLGDLNCVLINRQESSGRRAFDLAHELFHAMTWDAFPPQEEEVNEPIFGKLTKKNRTEQLADKFASALLMPAAKVRSQLSSVTDVGPEHVQALARHFGVSTTAMAFRLLSLGILNKDACNKFKGLPTSDAVSAPKPYSDKFMSLLALVLKDGLVSPRTVAKTLGLNLDELDQLLREWGHQDAIEF